MTEAVGEWPDSKRVEDIDAEVFANLRQPFPPEELEWKMADYRKKGTRAVVLCYVTGRAIMERLDQAVGPGNWENDLRVVEMRSLEHPKNGGPKQVHHSAIVSRLTIHLPSGRRISREDVCEGSDIEHVKGATSGALKRVGAMFGIGRYLYYLGVTFAQTNDRGRVEEVPRLPAWALPGGSGSPSVNAAQPQPALQPAASSGVSPQAAQARREGEAYRPMDQGRTDSSPTVSSKPWDGEWVSYQVRDEDPDWVRKLAGKPLSYGPFKGRCPLDAAVPGNGYLRNWLSKEGDPQAGDDSDQGKRRELFRHVHAWASERRREAADG